MEIIMQKSDATSTSNFFKTAISTDYIDSLSFNVILTADNELVIFNSISTETAFKNIIQNSTTSELKNYEIITLDTVLKELNNLKIVKNIYLNIVPLQTGIINDENIQNVTSRINNYIDILKSTVEKYPKLPIYIHSINRIIVSKMLEKKIAAKIGFILYENDLNFIDTDYYIITMSAFDDSIINMLINNNKKVILYLHSEYYIAFAYEHYLGVTSTPELQQDFKKIGIITNYPQIIYKVFET